jgi:hypothetical protein
MADDVDSGNVQITALDEGPQLHCRFAAATESGRSSAFDTEYVEVLLELTRLGSCRVGECF